jgi:hypothetical protein
LAASVIICGHAIFIPSDLAVFAFQFKLGWLYYRQVGGPFAFQYPADISAGLVILIDYACAVAHQRGHKSPKSTVAIDPNQNTR